MKDQVLADELLDNALSGAENAPSVGDQWRANMRGPVPDVVSQYRQPGLVTREDYVQSLMAPGHDPDRFA